MDSCHDNVKISFYQKIETKQGAINQLIRQLTSGIHLSTSGMFDTSGRATLMKFGDKIRMFILTAQ